jgi:hypothetical protein
LAYDKNVFVFYIEEKKIYYSEKENIEITEYSATGWDILYPSAIQMIFWLQESTLWKVIYGERKV